MRVLFFAQIRDAAGVAEIQIPAPTPMTAAELWTSLLTRIPALAPFQPVTRLARNCAYAEPDTRFGESDEVALIPPVSGG